MRFRLDEERWLPVVDREGAAFHVGLRELFERAHELRWLDAESPPVTAALHRLLLAVLHAGIEGPRDWRAWRELWQADELPSGAIQSYLDKYAGAFDLFDERRPFLQCPGLSELEPRSAAQLVHFRSVGNNGTLFDHTTADRPLRLSAAEAARWLVTVQCYDPGGLKTPYRTVKKSAAGPGNRFATVLVEGRTLKETLLLNACDYDPEHGLPWDSAHDDRPAWEAEPPGPEPAERHAHGWLDLLTWPARRVLLHPVDDPEPAVDGVVVTPGTTLNDELHRTELMAAFTNPATKTSKKAQPWSPVRLHELRGIWRHARKFLLAEDPQRHQRPMVLEHVADQVERGTVSPSEVFTIRVFGQQLDDSGGGSVYAWLQEQLPAPAALLRARHPWVGELLGGAAALADGIGDALTGLAKNCRKAFSAEHSAAAERAAKHNFGLVQDYWPKLPPAFAVLVRDLGDAVANGRSARGPMREWERTVRAIADAAAEQLVRQLRERQARHLDEIAAAHVLYDKAVSRHRRTFKGRINQHLPEEES